MRTTLALLALTALATAADDPAALGKPVRDFRLPDVLTGKAVRLADLRGKVVVVWFYSHGCTFCRQYEARLRQFAADHAGKGVVVLAVESTGRPGAAAAWKEKDLGFPLLADGGANTAAAFGATVLTTICVVDGRGDLRYRGAFDDSESGKAVRTRFVADAVAAVLADKAVARPETDAYGCLIPLPE